MESKRSFWHRGLIIAAGGAVVVYSFQLESSKVDLRRKQADVAACGNPFPWLKTPLRKTRPGVEQYRATVADHMAKNSRWRKWTGSHEAHRLLESAKAKWDVNVQLMQEALDQVRREFRNESIPEIPLKIGEPLKNCVL